MIAATAAPPAAAPRSALVGNSAVAAGSAAAVEFSSLLSDPRAAAPAPLAKAAGVGAAAPLTLAPESAAATTPAASAVMPQAQDQTAVPALTQAGAQTPLAAEVVVDPRPQALRGKPACRAPDPISLRAAEPGEPAGAEAPLLPVVSAEPLAATVKPAVTPETPLPADPAASLLSQLQLQLPPPAAPAFDPETARSSPAVVASVDAASGAAAGATPVLSGESSAGEQTPVAAAADAGCLPLAADSPPPAVAEGGRGSEALFALPASAAGNVAGAKLEPPPLPPPLVNTARQDWPEQLSSHISWQLGQDVQEARIELAPQDLGAIDLQVRVQDGRVQVHIGAAQQATRDLLSEALPRLRELLGDSGLSLSQASVFSQDAQSRGHQAWPARGGREAGELAASELPVALTPPRARGLLDHYA